MADRGRQDRVALTRPSSHWELVGRDGIAGRTVGARPKRSDAVLVSRTTEEYLTEMEQTNPVRGAKMISAADPDAVRAKKVGPAKMAYFNNYLMVLNGGLNGPN